MSSPAPTSPSPSGEQIELNAGPYRAVVVSLGGALRLLEHSRRPLLDGYSDREICDGARGQLLIPWANRIDEGRYEFAGETRQLDLTEVDRRCAIHGLIRWEEWLPEQVRPDSALLTHRLHPHPGYPHLLDLSVAYRLDPDSGLEIEVTARNSGSDPAPYGLGMHPYLTAGTPTIDSCELLIPAASRLPADQRGLPTGPPELVEGTEFDFRSPRPIGETRIDYAFTDLIRDPRGIATMTIADPASGHRSSLWVDSTIPWLEVFTGDHLTARQREGLGAEPMSCPPNGFASGIDLVVLQPGATHRSRWGITAA